MVDRYVSHNMTSVIVLNGVAGYFWKCIKYRIAMISENKITNRSTDKEMDCDSCWLKQFFTDDAVNHQSIFKNRTRN